MKKKTAWSLCSGGMLFISCIGLLYADSVKPWAKIDNVSERFQVLASFNSEAVLDRETGLVWQRSPTTENVNWGDTGGSFGGDNAYNRCRKLNIGDRAGWRVPTVEELDSLMVFSHSPGTPALPSNHPFNNLENACSPNGPCDRFWTSTDAPSGRAIVQDIGNVSAQAFPARTLDNKSGRVWCVRTGTGPVPLSVF